VIHRRLRLAKAILAAPRIAPRQQPQQVTPQQGKTLPSTDPGFANALKRLEAAEQEFSAPEFPAPIQPVTGEPAGAPTQGRSTPGITPDEVNAMKGWYELLPGIQAKLATEIGKITQNFEQMIPNVVRQQPKLVQDVKEKIFAAWGALGPARASLGELMTKVGAMTPTGVAAAKRKATGERRQMRTKLGLN